jgi:hypothetical protein
MPLNLLRKTVTGAATGAATGLTIAASTRFGATLRRHFPSAGAYVFHDLTPSTGAAPLRSDASRRSCLRRSRARSRGAVVGFSGMFGGRGAHASLVLVSAPPPSRMR